MRGEPRASPGVEEEEDTYPRFQFSLRSRIVAMQALLLGVLLISANMGIIRRGDAEPQKVRITLAGTVAVDLAVISLCLLAVVVVALGALGTSTRRILAMVVLASVLAVSLVLIHWQSRQPSKGLAASLEPLQIAAQVAEACNLTLTIVSKGYQGNLSINESVVVAPLGALTYEFEGPATWHISAGEKAVVSYKVRFSGDNLTEPAAVQFGMAVYGNPQTEDAFAVPTNAVNITIKPIPKPRNLDVLWSLDLAGIGLVQASGGPSVADIDADGHNEILIGYRKPIRADWSPEIIGENRLLCATDSGSVKWIFPPLSQPGFDFAVNFLGQPRAISNPTIADLDGDGRLEVLIGRRGGALHCLSSDGQELWSFSRDEALGFVSLEYLNDDEKKLTMSFNGTLGSVDTPQLYDNDRDGEYEIYLASGPPDNERLIDWGRVSCLDARGRLLWNVELDGLPSQPLVWDIDQDGSGEIVVTLSSNYVVCLDASNGVELWRRLIIAADWYLQSTPIAADVDKDGRYEILIGSNDGNFYVLSEAGQVEWSFKTPLSAGKLQYSPPVGDIDGDSNLETSFCDDRYVYCIDLYTRQQEWVFQPAKPDDSNNYNTFADVTGDGKVDVLVVSPFLYVLSNRGQIQAIFDTPKVHHNYWAQSGTWSGDLNNDGNVEILVKLSGEALCCLATGAPYDESTMPWPKMDRDPMNRPVVPIGR